MQILPDSIVKILNNPVVGAEIWKIYLVFGKAETGRDSIINFKVTKK